jgi:Uma2 family endonuclease
MEPAHFRTKLTYADYVAFPDDGMRHEIIGGEHYVTPSPVTRHQRISVRLLRLLADHVERHRMGEMFSAPFDVLLDVFDIVVPDLIYLSNERAHFLTEKNLQGPPDLVVEILSPSTRRRDQRLKRDLYERVGVREYWLVDPVGNVVTVFRRGKRGFADSQDYSATRRETLDTPLLPKLKLSLAKLFA